MSNDQRSMMHKCTLKYLPSRPLDDNPLPVTTSRQDSFQSVHRPLLPYRSFQPLRPKLSELEKLPDVWFNEIHVFVTYLSSRLSMWMPI